MRGRGAEFETVLSLLDGTQQGQGRVLLVEGEPGTGKSLLLARAGEEAGRRGFRVLAAAAGELSPAPSLDGLDELVSAGPVLVTVDNVQWADLATTQALRSMPRRLASSPLSWILAVGTSSAAGPAELLFGLLESDGAARISLGPLDLQAQVALIGDVLGAVPDQTLIELAADAAGNPLVLAEAFRGVRDETAIVVRDGRASLARGQVSSAQVTSRIETLARGRLRGLSAHTRRFVAAASVLGGSFRLEDVGEMLGESPGALLGALDEALSAYLLVVRGDDLAFRHEFVRQAVARMLAEPVQRALHWEYGRMLLARGGSAAAAAYHLLRVARPGDPEALAGLDCAVAEIAPFAPQAAAGLATGALALTFPSDPGRSVRTAAAARALTAAGQWEEAETLVRSALAVLPPAREAAAMRCALASLLVLTGRATEAMTEAQTVLTNSGVPEDLRDQATGALISWRGPSWPSRAPSAVSCWWPRWSRSPWPGGTRAGRPKRSTWALRPSARRRTGPTRPRTSALTCSWPPPSSRSADSTKPPRSLLPSKWGARGRKGYPRCCAPGSPWRRANSTMRSRWPNRPRGGWGPAGASSATHSRCRSLPPSPCAVATCLRPPNTCSGCRLSATTTPPPISPMGYAWWKPRSWRPAAGRGRRWTSWPTCWPACQSTGPCCWPIRPARPGWAGSRGPPATGS